MARGWPGSLEDLPRQAREELSEGIGLERPQHGAREGIGPQEGEAVAGRPAQAVASQMRGAGARLQVERFGQEDQIPPLR